MVKEVLIATSLIMTIAAVLTIIAKIIKQPTIIAYIISGIIVGPIFLNLINPADSTIQIIEVLSSIGISFLLFIVGLSLDTKILKEVGKISLFAGISQVLITTIIGFLIAISLNFNNIVSLYIAIALAFSSTVIVIKILSDKKEISTLHGRIALGILIVQDFMAAIALLIIPLIKQNSIELIFLQVGKITSIIILIFIFTIFILNKFLDQLAKSQEVLFIFSIAWTLLIATTFNSVGLSLEIGSLIAGMSLASTKYALEISSKIRPLRDFFIVLFFVYFGSQLTNPITSKLIKQAIIFSAFVLLIKPLIIMISMRLGGYKKRTNFLTGISLAQISEFSLILIIIGFNLNHLSYDIINLIILVSIITVFISSYSTYYSHRIFEKFSQFLNIFDGKREEFSKSPGEIYDVIIFGYNRIGYDITEKIKKIGKPFLVVDYNPKKIIELTKKKINCVYGDAKDKDFVNDISLGKAKLIISTITDIETNIIIKKALKKINSKATFIAVSEQIQETLDLYNEDIDYVIMPHLLGGKYMSEMIERNKMDKTSYHEEARKQIEDIRKRLDN